MNDHLGASLSALLDGNLDAAERAAAEAHLRTCALCRAEADAVRATLADLRALERPSLAETDRARLRTEVRKAHRVPRSVAMRLGAAAAIVALAAGGAMFLSRDGTYTVAGPFDAAQVQDSDYTEESARALLQGQTPTPQEFSVKSPARATSDAAGSPVVGGAEGTAAPPSAEDLSVIPDIDHPKRIAECEGIFLGTDDVIRVHRIVARYEGEPAYLLSYRVPKDEPTHSELWVVSIDGCEIRFFAQDDL